MSSILNGRCAFKRARIRAQSRCARAASAPRCARVGWAPQSQIKFKRTALICPLWCDRKAGNAACSVGCSEGKRPLRKKARTSGRLLVVARDDSDCMLSRVARIGRSLVARAKKRRRWLSHAQWTAGLASIASRRSKERRRSRSCSSSAVACSSSARALSSEMRSMSLDGVPRRLVREEVPLECCGQCLGVSRADEAADGHRGMARIAVSGSPPRRHARGRGLWVRLPRVSGTSATQHRTC